MLTDEAKQQIRFHVVERLKKAQTIYVLKDGRAVDFRPPNTDAIVKAMTWAAWRCGKLRANMTKLKGRPKMIGRMAATHAENEFERNLIIKLAPEFEIDLMGADK